MKEGSAPEPPLRSQEQANSIVGIYCRAAVFVKAHTVPKLLCPIRRFIRIYYNYLQILTLIIIKTNPPQDAPGAPQSASWAYNAPEIILLGFF